jgi:hypothetical protein
MMRRAAAPSVAHQAARRMIEKAARFAVIPLGTDVSVLTPRNRPMLRRIFDWIYLCAPADVI